MSKADKINLWRTDLINQYSLVTGEPPVTPSESIFTDEVVALAMDLDLCFV